MDKHLSIVELYRKFCVRFRELQRDIQQKKRTCFHCGNQESEHLHDSRCTCLSISRTFKATTAEEEVCVARTLEIIEELAEINNWNL